MIVNSIGGSLESAIRRLYVGPIVGTLDEIMMDLGC